MPLAGMPECRIRLDTFEPGVGFNSITILPNDTELLNLSDAVICTTGSAWSTCAASITRTDVSGRCRDDSAAPDHSSFPDAARGSRKPSDTRKSSMRSKVRRKNIGLLS